MIEKLIRASNYVILYSFFALLLVVPLTFSGSTYELFEFNKMWLTFGLAILIGCSWLVKMILSRTIRIQRSPLDLPILLFLISQIVSTVYSMEPHVSLWGYYSRFNGGLFSIISYVLLYFAFISNYAELETLTKNVLRKLILVALAGGAIVALWGLPSHFGYDPNCLVLVGSFDVSCWTEAFMPMVRIFSTFGQPNWLASYLAILLPVSLAFILEKTKKNDAIPYMILAVVFYFDLIFAKSQSGFLGALVGVIFLASPVILNLFQDLVLAKGRSRIPVRDDRRVLGAILGLFLLIAFFIGQPIHALNRFTLPELQKHIFQQAPTPPVEPTTFAGEFGGTDSGTIRKIVWLGALDIWRHNPLIGTGVETFAYSYYQYRPVAHNMTSEWDFLYNKAHNEYLNFLATTGAFGLGSYLSIIITFLYVSIKRISNIKYQINTNSKSGPLEIGLLGGYLSILVSNFFGFSTVVINIYFFLIPAFVLLLIGKVDETNMFEFKIRLHRIPQWIGALFIILTSLFLILTLVRYWVADTHFAKGYNLDRAGEYQKAYPELYSALNIRPSEPTFLDEYSYNTAILAVALSQNDQATASAMLKQKADDTSEYIVTTHPQNIVSWKTRVRAMYALSQIDKSYLPKALDAVRRASDLAPTDAKILYNEGVLYGQNNMLPQAIATLEKTVAMKPDYLDAWFALGLYYRDIAVDSKQRVISEAMQKSAVAAMEFIIRNFPKDQTDKAVETLKSWGN